MNNTLLRYTLFLLTSASLFACGGSNSKDGQSQAKPAEPQPLSVPDGFDYNMNRDISLRIQVLDHNGLPADRVGVQIFQPDNFRPSADDQPSPEAAPLPDLISRGQTNSQGYFEQQIRLPGHLRSIRVQVSQLGINNSAELAINTNTVFHEFK